MPNSSSKTITTTGSGNGASVAVASLLGDNYCKISCSGTWTGATGRVEAVDTVTSVSVPVSCLDTTTGITYAGGQDIPFTDNVSKTLLVNNVGGNASVLFYLNAGTGISMLVGMSTWPGATQQQLYLALSQMAFAAPVVITGANADALAVGANGTTNAQLVVDTSVGSAATGVSIQGEAAGSGITISAISSGSAEGFIFNCKSGSANQVKINDTLAAATSPLLPTKATDTITGSVTDGYTGGFEIAATVNAATSQTVTRWNALNVKNPTLGGAGPAVITNGCLVRFDAAAGTHKCVDSGSTKTTPGGVDAWIKMNINGTVYYMPAYTSKTA